MSLLARLTFWRKQEDLPLNLQRGNLGELAAKKYLRKQGLKFLTANFKSKRGEIDLVFRDNDCLVFVEVKTSSSEEWNRPAARVNFDKRRKLSLCSLDYIRMLRNQQIKFRFDIVEVLLVDGAVSEVRHLPNTFQLAQPYRHG
jgi:putative endonuclease